MWYSGYIQLNNNIFYNKSNPEEPIEKDEHSFYILIF